MPRNACFRTLIGPSPDAGAEPSGESEIALSVASSRRNAVTRTWRLHAPAPDGRRSRTECWIDLRQFADQEVEVTFSSSTASARSDEWPLAAWGDPAILARRPARDVWALYAGYVRLHGVRGALRRRRLAAQIGSLDGIATGPATDGSARPPRGARELAGGGALAPGADLEGQAGALPGRAISAPDLPLVRSPVVSIVIPTFNKAEYLYQCLESILAYTQVPFEVVVVDDCSAGPDAGAPGQARQRPVGPERHESWSSSGPRIAAPAWRPARTSCSSTTT